MLSAFILTTTFAFAQNKEVLEETITKTTKVKTNKGEQELKEQVQVRQEQNIELSEEDQNKIDQSRAASPMKVTKKETVVSGDVTLDSVSTYMCNGTTCEFSPETNGFTINSDDENLTAVISNTADDQYKVTTNNGNGVGYFDKNGDFVIEYFNKDENKIIKRVYTKQ